MEIIVNDYLAFLQKCYMDEIVTDQMTIVYNAGCRAKDVSTCIFNADHNLL